MINLEKMAKKYRDAVLGIQSGTATLSSGSRKLQ